MVDEARNLPKIYPHQRGPVLAPKKQSTGTFFSQNKGEYTIDDELSTTYMPFN